MISQFLTCYIHIYYLFLKINKCSRYHIRAYNMLAKNRINRNKLDNKVKSDNKNLDFMLSSPISFPTCIRTTPAMLTCVYTL